MLIAGLSVINHPLGALGLYGGDGLLKFVGYAALNVYALAGLLVSHRRGERWAWWVTWALVASYALVPFYETEVGPCCLGAALPLATTVNW